MRSKAAKVALCGVVSALSVVLMLILQKIATVKNWKWLDSFAMPFSMIGAMALVMLLAQVLPADIAFLEWRG